ncbi:unnamed protein product [Allacma fusca]|uniref:Uncharacterized protein n=1 Tax=Allacma fusca TaxID=39272 RepID=A0A8J2KK25_9HEXA|nr:unnamed protein product [Allacma fusca]
MQERLICCCGSSGWSRVIGWFQTIGNAVMVLLVGYQLGLVTYFTASNPEILDDADPIKAETAEAGEQVMKSLKTSRILQLRPDLLRAWIIYAHVGLIAGLVILTSRCFYAADSIELGVHIVSMALSVLIQGVVLMTTLWVTTARSEEMDMMEGADGELAAADNFNLGCGDCGTKCKFMCGSRRFRLCCLQYMKKRSHHPALKRDFIPETAKLTGYNSENPVRQVLTGMVPPLNLISYEDGGKVYGGEC